MIARIQTLIIVLLILTAASAARFAQQAVAAAPYSDKDCLSCHSAVIVSKKLKRRIEKIDPSQFAETPHKKLKCVECHSTAVLADKPKKHMTAINPVDCGHCHYKGNKNGAPNKDITKEYTRGTHGQQRINKHNSDAPYCKDCHGIHEILPPKNPRSTINRLNIHNTCGKCHGDKKLMRKYKLSENIAQNYNASVHGRGVLNLGLIMTAVCTDCHGSHDVRPPDNVKSPMNRKNIPITCGKCHVGILLQYRNSVHGKQWRKGNKDVPVCTDCHGEHNIIAPDKAASSVNPENIGATCSRCHDKKPLENKYNLPVDRFKSFQKSYHGTALTLNKMTVANCASCHGSHDILPSSDRNSSINPKNLPRTCGKCHPQAKKNLHIGKMHVSPSPSEDRLLFVVASVYKLLIAGTILGFLAFIGIDLFGARRRRKSGSH
jgi:hypothetical protein